jgi:hypothetical protein
MCYNGTGPNVGALRSCCCLLGTADVRAFRVPEEVAE